MVRRAQMKCVNPACGKLIYVGDRFWQVRRVEVLGWGLQEMYCPCCSKSCAEVVLKENADWLREKLDSVERQSFQVVQIPQKEGEHDD